MAAAAHQHYSYTNVHSGGANHVIRYEYCQSIYGNVCMEKALIPAQCIPRYTRGNVNKIKIDGRDKGGGRYEEVNNEKTHAQIKEAIIINENIGQYIYNTAPNSHFLCG